MNTWLYQWIGIRTEWMFAFPCSVLIRSPFLVIFWCFWCAHIPQKSSESVKSCWFMFRFVFLFVSFCLVSCPSVTPFSFVAFCYATKGTKMESKGNEHRPKQNQNGVWMDPEIDPSAKVGCRCPKCWPNGAVGPRVPAWIKLGAKRIPKSM